MLMVHIWPFERIAKRARAKKEHWSISDWTFMNMHGCKRYPQVPCSYQRSVSGDERYRQTKREGSTHGKQRAAHFTGTTIAPGGSACFQWSEGI